MTNLWIKNNLTNFIHPNLNPDYSEKKNPYAYNLIKNAKPPKCVNNKTFNELYKIGKINFKNNWTYGGYFNSGKGPNNCSIM